MLSLNYSFVTFNEENWMHKKAQSSYESAKYVYI